MKREQVRLKKRGVQEGGRDVTYLVSLYGGNKSTWAEAEDGGIEA